MKPDLRTITSVLAGALALSAPGFASAETSDNIARTSPVKVASCKVTSDLITTTDVDHPATMVAGRLWFGVTNEWPEPATEIRIHVAYGPLHQTIVERGVFTQGVRVDRTSDVTEFAPWAGEVPQSCSIVSVKFANGTAWMMPSQTALASATR